MERRDFFKVVTSGAAAVAVSPALISTTLYAHDGRLYNSYEKVQLTDKDGNPLKASSLEAEENYVFNYPFVGTPAMLLNLPDTCKKPVSLKTADGEEYVWNEGSGKNKTIVAYAAICTHSLTHPNKSESFFSYLKKGGKTMACQQSGVIVCSSHLSAFEPKCGAKQIAGPADQPLAAIVLEHNQEDDTLYAVGVLGSDKYHEYFKAFRTEMKKEWGGRRKAKKKVKNSAVVSKLNEYTKEIIQY